MIDIIVYFLYIRLDSLVDKVQQSEPDQENGEASTPRLFFCQK